MELTKSEIERLAILAEECGEVIQQVGKILRHNYEADGKKDIQFTGKTNRENLEEELGNLEFIIDFMKVAGDIDPLSTLASKNKKQANINAYLHYNKI